jgi:hypothetical protein
MHNCSAVRIMPAYRCVVLQWLTVRRKSRSGATLHPLSERLSRWISAWVEHGRPVLLARRRDQRQVKKRKEPGVRRRVPRARKRSKRLPAPVGEHAQTELTYFKSFQSDVRLTPVCRQS